MWPSVVVSVANDGNQQWSMVIGDSQGHTIGYGSGGRWWTTADGGGRWQRTVVKVNGKRINWYGVEKIVVRRYKIEREKLGQNKTNLKLIFFRIDFKSKLVQIKIIFQIFR